ncbi:unnamed protein product [Lactuca saligna]|uniref:Transposase MuDR plant domain-containing protein n=1 Tax=Lactuca saligna TaxID=75948 RepID=A0AA35Z6P8_LACSI|nr:unnamed protein product [Lactuca saligna]
MFDAALDDEINGEYCTPLNKTKDDEFLNKLCPGGGEEKKIEEIDNNEEFDNDVLEEHPIFNPHVHWKKQEPILGMRFEDPKQLKSMLCNYAVKNGYQLWFEKNDSKRLLVLCCKGACTFMLWASCMST